MKIRNQNKKRNKRRKIKMKLIHKENRCQVCKKIKKNLMEKERASINMTTVIMAEIVVDFMYVC